MMGEPALEIGCGDGDPLLDLVAAGLDVEGLDAATGPASDRPSPRRFCC